MESKDIIQFEMFKQFPQIVHAISTRNFGSMMNDGCVQEENLSSFLKYLNIPFNAAVGMQQQHTANATLVSTNGQKYIHQNR